LQETNIRRVYIYHFFQDSDTVSDKEIPPLLQEVLPVKKSRKWHWALMDYGAYLKTIRGDQGKLVPNPNGKHKNYNIQSIFEGSIRQIRGAILKNLFTESLSLRELIKKTKRDKKKIESVLVVMEKRRVY